MAEGSELTPAARDAIFKYVVSLTIPSAAVLAIIGGILGFFSKQIGIDEGYQAAYFKGSEEIRTIEAQASTFKGRIDQLLELIEKEKDDAIAARTSIDLLKSQADSIVGQKYTDIATQLIKNDDFRASLGKVNSDQLSTLSNTINDVKQQIGGLAIWGSDIWSSYMGNGANCPNGFYMTGVNFAAEGGLEHGALYAAQVTCRRINVPLVAPAASAAGASGAAAASGGK